MTFLSERKTKKKLFFSREVSVCICVTKLPAFWDSKDNVNNHYQVLMLSCFSILRLDTSLSTLQRLECQCGSTSSTKRSVAAFHYSFTITAFFVQSFLLSSFLKAFKTQFLIFHSLQTRIEHPVVDHLANFRRLFVSASRSARTSISEPFACAVAATCAYHWVITYFPG